MKLLSFLLIFLFSGSHLIAQSNVGVDIDSDLSVNNLRLYSVASFDTRDQSYKGSPLLWDAWMFGNILLSENSMYSANSYNVNYDALAHNFYVKIGLNIYTLPIDRVKKMRIVTAKDAYTFFRVARDENGQSDFYEILYSDDELELLSLTEVKLGKAYYNTALDAGNLKPTLSKSQKLFIYKSDRLFELPKKRKKFVKQYAREKELKEVVDFFKKKKVALKDKEEVQSALIEFNKTK